MMKKDYFKLLLLKCLFGKRGSSEDYKKYLIKKGVKIGDGTKFFYPRDVFIDETRPWLIEIGKNVQITKNVTLLTHGYDWSVLKGVTGEIFGSSGKIVIGNNVFIGFNVTILKGVKVGNNVIIAAGAVVTKNIPDNVVVAGVPATIISNIEDYIKKRKSAQYQEAKELVVEYYKKYNVFPKENILREFYFLFKKRDEKEYNKEFDSIMRLVNNYEQSMDAFNKSSPMFNGYEEFLNAIKKELIIKE